MPIQTLLVVHKFDRIASLGPEELRVIARALRCLCHRNGVSLSYTSIHSKEVLHKTYRNRLSHHLMGSEKKQSPQFNHIELVQVPVGTDSFAQIGEAGSQQQQENRNNSTNDLSADELLHGWQTLFETYFPIQAADAELAVNLDELKLLSEPTIDQLVQQKEEELKKKKREIDLQRKMAAADVKKR